MMKAKIYASILLTALLMMTVMTSVSALDLTTSKSEIVLSRADSSGSFTITNPATNTETIDITISGLPVIVTDADGNSVTLSTSSTTFADVLPGATTSTVTISRTAIPDDFFLGGYSKESVSIYAEEVGVSTNNVTVEVGAYLVNDFCKDGTINDSDPDFEITKVKIRNNGEGDDTDWLPLDSIEIKVEVEYDDDEDLDNVIVELGLIEKSTGKNVADELIWLSEDDEEVEVGDLDEDNDGTHTFEFKVDSEMGDTENYVLFVKAYPDGEEETTCIDSSTDLEGKGDFYQDISIDRETDKDRLVIVDDITIETSPALCGEEVVVSIETYNIAKDEEEKVKVSLYNTGLGLNLFYIIDDMSEGDQESIDFIFSVPTDASEDTYTLTLQTFYDWDDDEDEELDASYDEESEKFTSIFKVEGNCISEIEAEISPTLETDDSEVKAGNEVVIKATVKNTGDETATYTVGVEGNELFSTTEGISPTTLTLSADESKDVLITLKLSNDASGEQVFNLELLANGKKITQPVSLSIAAQSSLVDRIKGSSLFGSASDNWFIWAIVAINVILIVVIIAIAVRISRA